MATPDTRHSIVVKKSISYRGLTRTYTNRYHFEGDLPTSDAHWTTFADAIVTDEVPTLPTGSEITEVVGYDSASATSTNPHGDAVFTKVYSTAGTFTPSSTQELAPGDCCAFVRYATPARSVRNHPVYLSNYYHQVYIALGGGDLMDTDQKTAFQEYANDWIAGFSDGVENHVRCGPRGAVALSATVDQYIRHRDFPS